MPNNIASRICGLMQAGGGTRGFIKKPAIRPRLMAHKTLKLLSKNQPAKVVAPAFCWIRDLSCFTPSTGLERWKEGDKILCRRGVIYSEFSLTFTVTASQPWRVSSSPDTSSFSLSMIHVFHSLNRKVKAKQHTCLLSFCNFNLFVDTVVPTWWKCFVELLSSCQHLEKLHGRVIRADSISLLINW